MTPAEIQVWIILFMGLGTIITSIGTCVGIIITATRTGVIGSKVDVIHDQTNSRLSRMDADLKRRFGYALYLVEAFKLWATHRTGRA